MFAIYKDLDDEYLPYILVERGGSSRKFCSTIEECLTETGGSDNYRAYNTVLLCEAETLDELRLLMLLES